MALIHLIYVSAASREYSDAELDDMLASSIRHNTPQGITGMLLYAGGNFIQVLEGEAAAVDETYDRITRDPRHHGLILIERCAIREREFPQWQMGFRRLSQADIAAGPAFFPLLKNAFDTTANTITPGIARELMAQFVLQSA